MSGYVRMSERSLPALVHVKSWLFVAIQFLCLCLLALTGPLIPVDGPLFVVELFGFMLGLWAVVVMKPGRFSIGPRIAPGGSLVVRGPYRYIRHPMYAALILVTFPLLIDAFTFSRLGILSLLYLDLLLKLRVEEHLLASHFPGYIAYQQATKRLIPGIW